MVFVNLLLHIIYLHKEFLLFSVVHTISKKWGKFEQILERKEQEFRRAMEEEVSIISILLR